MITLNRAHIHCLACGKELKGRIDQKFCNDGCRNLFNNNLKLKENEIVGPVFNALKKNRRILVDKFSLGIYTVSREDLLKAGFDFRYSTRYLEFPDTEHAYFAAYFEFTLEPLSATTYAIGILHPHFWQKDLL